MKSLLLISAVFACALLAVRAPAATNVVPAWSAEVAAAQQTAHQDADGRARADALLRAVHDAAQSGLAARELTGRPAEGPPAGANLDAATAYATYSVLMVLYPQSRPAFDVRLAKVLAVLDDRTSAIVAGKKWGEQVARDVLAEQDTAVVLDSDRSVVETPPSRTSAPAKAPKVPVAPLSAADEQSAQATIDPGRYRFSVLAGTPGAKGYVDATGAAARFDSPGGIAVDRGGNVYLSESKLNTIRKISPAGVVSTVAGSAGQKGSLDGSGAAARFNQPSGLAVDGVGNVYVADTGNNMVRRIDPLGNVTTLAGVPGGSVSVDGPKATARFYAPAYVAVDAVGDVFVTEDKWNERFGYATSIPIRKIAPDGTVSSLKVAPTSSVYEIGPIPRFYFCDLAKQIYVDRGGTLYVVDSNYWDFFNVVKLAPTADGKSYTALQADAPNAFGASWVTGIGLDETDSLFILTATNSLQVRLPDGGLLSRFVGGDSGGFDWTDEVAVGGLGDLYVIRTHEGGAFGAVLHGEFDPRAAGPTILGQPESQRPLRGTDARFQVTASGVSPLSYQWYFNFTPINGANASALELKNVQQGDLGSYAVVVTDSTGSVTSLPASLSMYESPPATPSVAGGSVGSTGGGCLDQGFSLAALGLIAVAAGGRRMRRTSRSWLYSLPGNPAAAR